MTDLSTFRAQIDEVDLQILSLIEKRLGLAKEIGQLKRSESKPIRDPEREKQVIDRLSSKTNLDSGFVETIFKQIISFCRENE